MKKLTKAQRRVIWKLVRHIDGRVIWLQFSGISEREILKKLERRGYIYYGGALISDGKQMVTYWPTNKGCRAIGIKPIV